MTGIVTAKVGRKCDWREVGRPWIWSRACFPLLLRGRDDRNTQPLRLCLNSVDERYRTPLDDITGHVRIQDQQAYSGSRGCGAERSLGSKKSSGTSIAREKNDAQSGLIGEINRLSPCFRMRTSFTASENLNS
jgi:hypothetical protein